MLKLSKISEQVHWCEGMLLSQHHFQQTAINLAQSLAHQLQRLCPYYWGILELSVDELELATNKLVINVFHGVMSDGTVIQYRSSGSEDSVVFADDTRLALDLNKLDVEVNKAFRVCIAIALESDACASDENTDFKRYLSVNSGLTADRNDINNKLDIVRLVPYLRLVLEENLSPNYAAFPLIKLEKKVDGTFSRLKYTPPSLSTARHVTGASTLWAQVESVVASARVKATQLRSMLDENRTNQSQVQFQRDSIVKLTRNLSGVEISLESETHPFDLYRCLTTYASDLASLNADPTAPKFPKYSHNHLNEVFTGVLRYISRTIDMVAIDYISQKFFTSDRKTFSTELDCSIVDQKLYIVFKIPDGVLRADCAKWVDHAFICTSDQLGALRVNRDLGFIRSIVSEIPKFKITANTNEIVYEVALPVNLNAGDQILVVGSEDDLEFAKSTDIFLILPRSS